MKEVQGVGWPGERVREKRERGRKRVEKGPRRGVDVERALRSVL